MSSPFCATPALSSSASRLAAWPWIAGFASLASLGCSRWTTSSPPTGAQELSDPPVSFPLKLSEDRRYVVDQNGAPFLIHGDSAWSLIARLKNDDVETYLEDRRRRGFNVVLVNLIEHKFSDHPPRNAYGQAPFASPGDFSAPNAAYFEHADWVIRAAATKGIAVLLAPAYLGQDGGDEGFYQEMLRSGPEALRRYGAYVGGRYGAFDNVVWVLGGDYSPPPEGLVLVRALGEGIRAADRRHLVTAHWAGEHSAQDVEDATIRGWLDLDSTYTYQPVFQKSLSDYLRAGALPHFLIETAYEREHDSTPRSLRAQAYDALLTGAVGQIFGSGPIWGFWSWKKQLGSEGSTSMTQVRRLFEGRPWMRLVPDDGYAVLRSGPGGSTTLDHALLASTADGTLAIAYTPTVRTLTIDGSKLKAPWGARWYDPTAGTYSAAHGRPAEAAGHTSFEPPGNNAAGDADWVLVLASP